MQSTVAFVHFYFLFVFRPLKNTTKLTYVISQVINLVKLTNLG